MDDTGHSWRRIDSWVEPGEADELIARGIRHVVQSCDSVPSRGRPERFRTDIRPRLVEGAEAATYRDARVVPTVMIGELWHSERDGDLLLFVEQGPFPRTNEELVDTW